MYDESDRQDAPPLARNHMQRLGEREGVVAPVFAEHAFRPTYAFTGVPPYIDREAQRVGFADHSLRSTVKGDWFVTSASNALGNACCQPKREDAQASLDRAVALRDTLSLALAGIDAAILEVTKQLDLPEPPFARKPEVNNGPRRLRKSEHPGE